MDENKTELPTENLDDLEKRAVEQALAKTSWNKTHAARLLGVSLDTLRRRVRDFGMPDAPRAHNPYSPLGTLESDLAKPVMDWLERRGLIPYGEVAYSNRAIDIVGLNDTEVEAVELKRCLSRQVIHQAYINQLASHRSWCAVASRPREFSDRLHNGLGLLVVYRGEVEVIVEATRREDVINQRRIAQIRGACHYKVPRGPAGLPNMKGIGPAQSVYDAVQRYTIENPRATWQEIFASVPNHYAHFRSMQGAMGVIRERRLRKA